MIKYIKNVDFSSFSNYQKWFSQNENITQYDNYRPYNELYKYQVRTKDTTDVFQTLYDSYYRAYIV